MNAVELGKPDIFVATDPIASAKELQAHLAGIHPEAQPQMAAQAIEALGDPRELYGGHKLWLHALGAHVLRLGLSDDEMFYHGTYFGDATFNTGFSRFAFVQHPSVRSLCLMLVESKIVASQSNPEFVGERICSGVFVPVHAVESAFAA